MSDERWMRIDQLLQSALGRPPQDREAFVRAECPDDEGLRDEVLSLLAHEGSADKFLEPPPARAPLKPGAKLGAYEIRAQIGEGGMGEVYRAHDSRLRRDIALKILPPEAADAERRQRFAREAQAVAALNHPGIVTIHSVEQSGDIHFLTMELVDGKTLADRLRQGRVPIDEVIALSRQIVDALEVAHERGIIHRDLKPANIKITPDGVVKILDFGLAKLTADPRSGEAANSPTFTAAAGTEVGVILGTAAYMSPEQARGRPVDKRTDVWAFGCVLYELLTGKRAFVGDTVTDILAAVVSRTPDWNALPAATPSAAVRLLRRCLEPDQKLRLRDISVARLELDDASKPDSTLVVASTPRRRGSAVVPWLIAAAAMIALVLILWSRPERVEWNGFLVGDTSTVLTPRISPDGLYLAFLTVLDGQTQLAVQPAGGGTTIVHTHDRTRGSISNLCWSPNGKRIYFDRSWPSAVYSITLHDVDQERLVMEGASAPQVLGDGSLLVRRRDEEGDYQIYRAWLDPVRFEAVGVFAQAFRTSPDGRQVAFVGRRQRDDKDDVHVLDVQTGQSRKIASGELRAGGVTFDADGESALLIPAPNSGPAAADSRRIVRVPLDGSGEPETILTLASRPTSLDVDREGSIYMSQRSMQVELFRTEAPDGDLKTPRSPERVVEFPFGLWSHGFLPLPGGRVLISPGRNDWSLLLVNGDRQTYLLPDNREKPHAPAALVGDTELVHKVTPGDLVVTSLANRAIVRRIEGIQRKGDITSIAVSPDDKTIYYTERGTIYSIPIQGGMPIPIGKGDSIVMDRYQGQLIVRLTDNDGTRLFRRSLDDTSEREVRITGGYRFVANNGNPQAVDRFGRIIWTVAHPASWFEPIGVVNPDTGDVKIVRAPYPADLVGGWTDDGRILFSAYGLQSTLWRFTRVKK